MTALAQGRCNLCGAPVTTLFAAVPDHYFGFPGSWDIVKCTNAACGAGRPEPGLDDLSLQAAYASYYTHDAARTPSRLEGMVRSLLVRIGGVVGLPTVVRHGHAVPWLGCMANEAALAVGAMSGARKGSVVDVGCGNGDRLSLLHAAGWSTAIGVESDPAAVQLACSQGRRVLQGTAERLPFEDATVEGVQLHHVIEHVRDPRKALAEAARVLVPGSGRVFISTPNLDSANCARWQGRWRGLEAPRHLNLFTVPALQRLLVEAGFTVELCRSSARSAHWMECVSSGSAPGGSLPRRLLDADRKFRAQEREIARGIEVGDEVIAVARKHG